MKFTFQPLFALALSLSSMSFAQSNAKSFDCQGKQDSFRLIVENGQYSVAADAGSSPVPLVVMSDADKKELGLPVKNPFYYKGDNDIWIIQAKKPGFQVVRPLEADEWTGQLGQTYLCAPAKP